MAHNNQGLQVILNLNGSPHSGKKNASLKSNFTFNNIPSEKGDSGL